MVLDVASIAETVGLADWHSPAQWNLAKLPFADAYVPLYAEHVAQLIGAMRGKSHRCLVLDLDNTVWGGVIGDDGMEGIRNRPGRRHRRSTSFGTTARADAALTRYCTGSQFEEHRQRRETAVPGAPGHASEGRAYCGVSGQLERQGDQYPCDRKGARAGTGSICVPR